MRLAVSRPLGYRVRCARHQDNPPKPVTCGKSADFLLASLSRTLREPVRVVKCEHLDVLTSPSADFQVAIQKSFE